MAVSEELKPTKWGAILKLEGYTTPAKQEALVQEFHKIMESFKEAGVELDVYLFMESDQKQESPQNPNPLKRLWERE